MSDPASPLLVAADGPPFDVTRADGAAGFLVICEHASATIPASLGTLGMAAGDRLSHAAWDPGALDIARALSERFDAPLVAARFSRLVYDLNRPPASPDAMRAQSERIAVPGNATLTPQRRAARVTALYDPFHDAVAAQIDRMGRPAIVTIHSFTPVYHGKPRGTEIGILFDPRDDRLARAMLQTPDPAFATEPNAPYGPGDGVFHTLERHALPRGLLNAMVEVRNDLATARTADITDTLSGMIDHAMSRFSHLAGA